jgi:hypothetical protein
MVAPFHGSLHTIAAFKMESIGNSGPISNGNVNIGVLTGYPQKLIAVN